MRNLHYEKFADGCVKCIEDEIPFDLPDGWAWCRLQSIATIQSSKRVFEKDYVDDGIPFYRSKEIGDLSRNEEIRSQLFITESHYLELKDKYGAPQIGDILITSVGSIGNTWICDGRQFYYKDGNITQIVANSFFVSEYVQLFLKTDYFFEQVGKTVSGSAYNALTIEKLKNILFALPPYNEQQRIVNALKPYNELVETVEVSKTDLLQLLSKTKAKILDLAIRGQLVPQDPSDEPVSVLLERIRAGKEELIKQGKIKRDKKQSVIFRGDDNSYYEKIGNKIENIDDEIPFELPDGWMWCRGQSCFEGMDSTKPQGEFFDYIDIDAIDNRLHQIKAAKHLPVSEAPSRASRAVRTGSVLFSLVRPYLENIALVEEQHSGCIASTGFFVCNSNGVLLPEFMYYLMISGYVVNGLNQYMKGDNSPSISKENIENWLYPVPPLKEQKAICTKLRISFNLIENVEKSLS